VATSIGLGVLAFAPAAAAGSVMSSLAGGNDVVRLATAVGLWATLAGGVTVFFGRLLLVERIAIKPAELALVLIAGGVAAAVAEGGVVAWMIDHYGKIQSEVAGLGYVIAIAFALLTSATAAALVAVGTARAISLAAVAVATAGVVFAAASNLPGVSDGISPSGPALALSFGAAGAYTILANFLLLRTRRRFGS